MLINRLAAQSGNPGGPDDTWPRRLTETYLNWAEQKGYEFDLYTLHAKPDAPEGMAFTRISAGNFKDMLARFGAQPQIAESAIYMQGSNVFGFLKGERGLHKLAGRESNSDDYAQVRVYAIPDTTNIEEWLRDYLTVKAEILQGKRAEPPQAKYTVIRTYSLERTEKYIRDLRTGLRLANVKDVMGKGLLDELILAYLQTDQANVTWEDRFPPTFPY
jgi:protein subunit release factor B